MDAVPEKTGIGKNSGESIPANSRPSFALDGGGRYGGTPGSAREKMKYYFKCRYQFQATEALIGLPTISVDKYVDELWVKRLNPLPV